MIEQSFSHCGRIHRGERADTACSSRYARRQTSNRYSNIQFNLTLPKNQVYGDIQRLHTFKCQQANRIPVCPLEIPKRNPSSAR